jgi:hypothetical protein
LLTALKNREKSSSLLIKRFDYKYTSSIGLDDVFLRTHSVQSLLEMNENYFKLGDSLYEEIKISNEAESNNQ